MRIETYSDKWFLDVVKLIENFHKEAVGEYDKFFSLDAVIETIKSGDRSNAFLLIVDEVCQGILYGVVAQSPTSGKQIFQELIWYVNKPFRKYGVKLFRDVEKSLQSRGVSIIIMAVLENSKTDKLKQFYTLLGYKPMEVHYFKKIND